MIESPDSARDGGADLVAAAVAAARDRLPDRGMRHVDVRRELPEGWALFEPPGGGPRELPLRLLTRAQLVLHYGRDDRQGLSRPGR